MSTMKIVSFNVNGIRARMHQLAELVRQSAPDVIGLQEIKVEDALFPQAEIEALGYHVAYFGQKGHHGVAIMTKAKPVEVIKGFPGDAEDAQKRAILCKLPVKLAGKERVLQVFNGYFPQGESRAHPDKFPAKQAYYANLSRWLGDAFDPAEPIVVMGDMNVAPIDQDIGIGTPNMKRWLREGKCCFLPEEREWIQHLMGWGLKDTYRSLYPDIDDKFSWFDYRSKGFDREPKRGLRIDLILATETLRQQLVDAGIDYAIRGMEKPSDHAPVWATFDAISTQ